MNKDLSIIIPVYNTEPYLRKCLDSVIKNVPKNTEIIIINDGSPDNADSIIKEYEKKYSDLIKYFKKENGGLSDTKNYGLKRANGKYITFVDSDDFVDINMHSDMLSKALNEDADVVYCDVELVFDNKSKNFVSVCSNNDRKTDYFKCIDTSLMAASWNKIIKKELYSGMEFPTGLNNEDVAVTPIILARAKKIIKIDKPYYKYYQRTGSIQNSGFSDKRFVIFDTTDISFEKSKEFSKEIQEQIKGALFTHQILAILIYIIGKEKLSKRKKFVEKYFEYLNKYNWDVYENQYVIEYLKNHDKYLLLKLLKNNKVNAVTYIFTYYNILEKFFILKAKIKRLLNKKRKYMK